MNELISKALPTFWVKLYLSGPIEDAKRIIRAECMREGLCITIEQIVFIYTGGEELGYVVGLIDYPRFPSGQDQLIKRSRDLAIALMDGTHQWSALMMTPTNTEWLTRRPQL